MGSILYQEEWHSICLYCGKQKKSKYEEYEQYYECDCSNAVSRRRIEEKIDKLKQSIPDSKYLIQQERVIRKL